MQLCDCFLNLLEPQIVIHASVSLPSTTGKSLVIFLKTVGIVDYQNSLCLEVVIAFIPEKKIKH